MNPEQQDTFVAEVLDNGRSVEGLDLDWIKIFLKDWRASKAKSAPGSSADPGHSETDL